MRVIALVCLALILLPAYGNSAENIADLLQSLRTERENILASLNSIENELTSLKQKSQQMQIVLADWSEELEKRKARLIEQQEMLKRQEQQLIESEKLRKDLMGSFDSYQTEAEGIIGTQQTILIAGGIGAGALIVVLTIALIAK